MHPSEGWKDPFAVWFNVLLGYLQSTCSAHSPCLASRFDSYPFAFTQHSPLLCSRSPSMKVYNPMIVDCDSQHLPRAFRSLQLNSENEKEERARETKKITFNPIYFINRCKRFILSFAVRIKCMDEHNVYDLRRRRRQTPRHCRTQTEKMRLTTLFTVGLFFSFATRIWFLPSCKAQHTPTSQTFHLRLYPSHEREMVN